VLAAAACGTSASTADGPTPPAGSALSPATPGEPAAPEAPSDPAASASAPILGLEITDARTGETFTLADYAGTPLFVENFATWCSNCRTQLQNVQAAASESGDDAAFVALSVETDLSPDDIASYARDEGFDDIRVAALGPEMLAAMNDQFGNSALNPPATPHFVVQADGAVGELGTGFEDPDQVRASLGLAG